jgi:hypothetical protein
VRVRLHTVTRNLGLEGSRPRGVLSDGLFDGLGPGPSSDPRVIVRLDMIDKQ